MKTYTNPAEDTWNDLLKRPLYDVSELEQSVKAIIEKVKQNGDRAVKEFTYRFDKVELETLRVSPEELNDAKFQVSRQLQNAIEEARMNIETFHARQLHADVYAETTPGVRCWQKTIPIDSVGLYIPGGSAPLLSTVLMLGVPARIAGCKNIVLCSPPDRSGQINPVILYIAEILGITNFFKAGGAQAIAAMAHGTESIPRVNKIFGPGNQYVTTAKQIVSRDRVAIDMPAGPSELVVMADESADASYVASDLLSQAEHGPDSQVLLVTDDEKLIKDVVASINDQLSNLPRKKLAEQALRNSKLILLKNKQLMVRMINLYAPEHLIIACNDYMELAEQIKNAGSIFLGNYTPESAGDYASGTNHTLPTNGWAHAYGGLNMDAFVKKITFQEITKYGLFNISSAVTEMAAAEELQAHSNAVSIRLKNAEI
ncbi:MAG: histidinol dehydrogenase [Bacteroidales bacterium]|nr:histidinol dehydrogenase [Bacteroidales bacterium]